MCQSGHPATVTARRRSRQGCQPGSWTPRKVPDPNPEFPSPALGATGGEPDVTDPEDKKGLRLLQPVMPIDLRLPTQHLERVGGRAWVRFDHGSEPLASQFYRYGRQLFLICSDCGLRRLKSRPTLEQRA